MPMKAARTTGRGVASRVLPPVRLHPAREVRSGPIGALHSLQRAIGNRATSRLVQLSRAGRSGAPDRSSSALADGVTRGRGAGRQLDPQTRARMEAGFGVPFGDVRVHTDAHAAQKARALGALAYTVGRDVFFGIGRYQPAQQDGRRLLAHELTHVLQQASRSGSISPGMSSRSDPAEHQAEQVAARLAAGASHVGALGPTSPASVQRAEPEPSGSIPQEPVELPPVDVASTEVLELAERTAEEINNTVTPDWETVRGGTEFDALLMANKIEHILRDTFEVGHGAGQQLREADAPVLQYLVAQYPDLRARLVVLRDRAGAPNTLRFEKFLGIQMAETRRFAYEIHMIGMSGGKKGIEVAEATVKIRYVEEGKPVWTASYEFLGAGVGLGLAPGGQSEDVGWNTFYTAEYWEPGDFPGMMDIVGASGLIGGGWESEAATIHGGGARVPLVVDVGGQIAGTPEAGVSLVRGKLTLLVAPRNAPTPPPPPTPPGLAQPIPIHDQLIVGFDTNDDQLDNAELRMLADFVSRNSELFAGKDYVLQLIGNASRAGKAEENLGLSERRRQEVQAEINALLKFQNLPPLRPITGEALGEQQAELAEKPKTDDSAEDRTVEIALNGTVHRDITPP
jgi:outer membrane protein OmpA-like peptidoglycan-associated protein